MRRVAARGTGRPLALTAVSLQAHAHVDIDICAMKRSQSEAQQCYEYGADGGMLRMKENFSLSTAFSHFFLVIPQRLRLVTGGDHTGFP
ncbi:exported hypothetical protein [Paraburkholderia piptadeniae]|uniref:Uncharacterized protein n=1 Tax=Paraburkholderia piptadeniae TaxID=1701573 RepID=A0A1N7RYL5_9BURK|nr:exported hypothetical protein [Paraburkholderia piptadeniae]